CFTARTICLSQPAQIFCLACIAAFQLVWLRRQKRRSAVYTGAFISDRQTKMACKPASALANGLRLITCGPRVIAREGNPLPVTRAQRRPPLCAKGQWDNRHPAATYTV